ncbi:MAG: hypothetical protein PQ612_10780 [Rickettsiales bacterium]|nr:hypothetical protein [Pseudomonadota bacterium]MDA0966708.1 hypothetical protein [Pseudomonadota bacterium]MDG4544481.1 hypothetical protein [Rickettsiales bacterium]MDG4546633.1 hypothetical protein [Rickettsiales bacterium]MDG4548780.1 hypothetical protein [Rickettsiales bacterium]
MTDLKKFNQTLNQYSPDEPLSQQDTNEAFHNLAGFMSLLIKVNEREKIVSFDEVESEGNHD